MAALDQGSPQASGWGAEIRATLALGLPLIVAQLANIMLMTTDVVMMGWLGPKALAAGSLATSLLHPLVVGGVGVVFATAPLIAQALGAREHRAVRRIVRQGLWIAALLTFLISPIVLNAEPIFLKLGQVPDIATLAQSYLNFAVFMVFPWLGLMVFRSLLQARGDATIILWITLVGAVVNGFADYGLMFGQFGLPRMGVAGTGLSTSIVNWIMFLLALVFVLKHRRYRRYYVLVRLWKPDWPRFFEVLRVGIPIGLTLISEVSLFGLAVIMMGWIGTDAVAAHAVALQLASITFMVPLGLSQATTVRVGLFTGARNRDGIGRAGWTSLFMVLLFMSGAALVFVLTPAPLIGLFLDPTLAKNTHSIALATAYLGIAGLFQLFDGTQVIMAAALRGMNDTRMPMLTAMIGYWVVGIGIAYWAGFGLGFGGIGIWFGLASGLAFVAIVLSIRFSLRDRLRLMERARGKAAPPPVSAAKSPDGPTLGP